jgi:hypothetical protein
MGKACRDKQLLLAIAPQLDRNVPSKSCRGAAKIDRNIEDASAQHAHKFRLGERWPLKVQATNSPGAIRARLIVLDETAAESLGREI